jgi:hypothetical protein
VLYPLVLSAKPGFLRRYLFLFIFLCGHLHAKATTDSCQLVRGLRVSGVSPYTATLSWDETAGSVGYQYVVSKTSTPPDKFGLFVTKPVHVADKLAANTTYYAHVRTSCHGALTSGWVTVQFNTPDPVENNLVTDPPFAVQSYPLDTEKWLTVKVRGSKEDTASVALTDILGRPIRTYTVEGDRIHIEVSALPSNVYLLRYNDALGRIQTMRFTKR